VTAQRPWNARDRSPPSGCLPSLTSVWTLLTFILHPDRMIILGGEGRAHACHLCWHCCSDSARGAGGPPDRYARHDRACQGQEVAKAAKPSCQRRGRLHPRLRSLYSPWPRCRLRRRFRQRTRPPEARAPVHQVQRDVEAIARALYEQDVATLMRFTHPAIVQIMGGPEVAKRAVTAAAVQIARVGMKIEAFSFPSPPQFFEASGRRFVFVPTLTIIAAKAGRVESLNFQCGVLEPAARDWKYIEGSRLTHAMAESLFPGFPKERPFPPFYRKKL
jgi:hypothetical protein